MKKKKKKKIRVDDLLDKNIKEETTEVLTKDKDESSNKNVVKDKKNIKLIIIISLVVLLLLIIGFLMYLKISSKFKYDKYDKKLEYNIGDKINIKEPIVCYGHFIKCKNIKAKIKGKVDNDKLGTYNLEYTYKYKKKKLVLKRSVIIKDLEKPKININDQDIKVCPNGKILKLDLSATDNFDGDVTKGIETGYSNNKVIAKVKDSSGNEGKIEIDVEPKDEEGPVITLNGLKNMSNVVGLNYAEAGAKAVDNCDGEVKVDITGSVDINTVGEYVLTYTAVDSAGNKSTAERKVTIKNRVEGNKVIYLTFDDGPGFYTSQLLDVLDKYNVKATFFVTNQFPKYQYLIGEEAKRGHSVAVHTLTHKWNIYDSVDAYINDFNAMNDIIEQQTGSRTKLFRFPGGSSNTVYCGHNKTAVPDIIAKMNELGNIYFDWNLSSGDAGNTTKTEQVYKNVINGLKADNSIVLQHDIKGFSVNAVEKIIEYGLNNGYTFKALDENSPTAHHGVHICKQ